MLLICIIISAVFGYSASSSYNRGGSNIAADSGTGYFLPPLDFTDRHWRSSSSSESDEEWGCRSLHVFNVSNTFAPLFYKPNIAYFTHQGVEKAIVVCPNPQLQMLVGKSRKANYAPQIEDYPLVSLSSKSGITLDCNKRKHRYEAINLFTFKTVPLEAIVCITKKSHYDGISAVITALQEFGFSL